MADKKLIYIAKRKSMKCSHCGKFVTPMMCRVNRLWYGDEHPEIICRSCEQSTAARKKTEAAR
jgi:hypothetical protein